MEQNAEKKWFVFLGDRHDGPFSLSEMKSKLDEKQITMASYAWAEGMADWKPMKDIPELGALESAEGSKMPATPEFSAGSFRDPSLELNRVGQTLAQGLPHDEAVSLPVDKRALRAKLEGPAALNEAHWKRRRMIRRVIQLAMLLLVLGGGGYAYTQGALDSVVQSPAIVSAWNSASDRVMPQLLLLSEKFPILAKYISPIPRLEDVSPEDYLALKAAASSGLDQKGPVLSVALSKSDLLNPSFYVTSNLPEGAQFDIYVEGLSDTLVGQLQAAGRTSVAVSKKLGKSTPIVLGEHKGFPRGEYTVFVTESDKQPNEVKDLITKLPPLNAAGAVQLPAGIKLLARRSYFLGGTKDATYLTQLKDYHVKLTEKARLEVGELGRFVSLLTSQFSVTVNQFQQIKRGRSISSGQKRSWSAFHGKWSKEEDPINQAFAQWTPEKLKQEFYYGVFYEQAQQAVVAIQRLHSLQNDVFERRVDVKTAEIQLGEASAVAQNYIYTLKTNVEKLEKASPNPNGMPPGI